MWLACLPAHGTNTNGIPNLVTQGLKYRVGLEPQLTESGAFSCSEQEEMHRGCEFVSVTISMARSGAVPPPWWQGQRILPCSVFPSTAPERGHWLPTHRYGAHERTVLVLKGPRPPVKQHAGCPRAESVPGLLCGLELFSETTADVTAAAQQAKQLLLGAETPAVWFGLLSRLWMLQQVLEELLRAFLYRGPCLTKLACVLL